MAVTKLLNIGELSDGTMRLQGQLSVLFNLDQADYVLKNGKLRAWGHGEKGFDFYPTDMEYEIVKDRTKM